MWVPIAACKHISEFYYNKRRHRMICGDSSENQARNGMEGDSISITFKVQNYAAYPQGIIKNGYSF